MSESSPPNIPVQSRARDRTDRVVDLMLRNEWNPEIRAALKAEWGVADRAIDQYASTASYYISRLDQRETSIERIQGYLEQWLAEGKPDRVQAARVLLESWGALKLNHEVTVKPDREWQWRRVGEWLENPSPELERLLNAKGWTRAVLTEGVEDG